MVLVTHIPDSWTGQRQKGPLAGAAARGAARADILLTAMWMPGMDGAALARRVRSEAAFAGIRIVAVTADAETEATFDMSAFDAVLTKPVTDEKLRAVCSPP